MRYALIPAIAMVAVPSHANAPQPAPTPIKLACAGPEAIAIRRIAAREKLTLATYPQACLAQASMYGGSSKQIIAAAPSAACGKRNAIQVYERSRAGPWSNLLERPVCGTNVAFGPNNRRGAVMITIDGKHYDQRGAYYTPVSQ